MSGTYTGTGDEVVDMLGKSLSIIGTGEPEATIIDGEVKVADLLVLGVF
jgi:hypothetical protein